MYKKKRARKKMGNCLIKSRFLGYEIPLMVWLMLSAIYFPAVSYAKDEIPGFLPIKNYPIIADSESTPMAPGFMN